MPKHSVAAVAQPSHKGGHVRQHQPSRQNHQHHLRGPRNGQSDKHEPKQQAFVWPADAPSNADWQAFFSHTNTRRQLVAVDALIGALLDRTAKESYWLESGGVTAAQRLADLVHWVTDRLPPTLLLERASAAATLSADRDDDHKDDHEVGNHQPKGTQQEADEDDPTDDGTEEDEDEYDESDDGKDEDNDNAYDDSEGVNGSGTCQQLNNDHRNHEVKTKKVSHQHQHHHHQQQQQRSKKERERIAAEWALQVRSLRLLSALAVVCGQDVHLLAHYDRAAEAALPERALRRGSLQHRMSVRERAKGKVLLKDASESGVSCGLIELLQRIIVTAKSNDKNREKDTNGVGEEAAEVMAGGDDGDDAEERERRSGLRAEAARTMAVVCFLMDDPGITMEACRFLADCYLPSPPDHLVPDTLEGGDGSDSDTDDDEDDEDEDEDDEEEDEDNGNDEEEDEDDEDEEDDEEEAVADDWWSEHPEQLTGEQAEALRTVEFLLAFVDDASVRGFLGDLIAPLTALLLNDRRTPEAAQVRMRAGALLSIVHRLPGDEEKDGDDEEEASKRRFVALCRAKGRSRGGQRARGRERRASERRERAFFRDLAHELAAERRRGQDDAGHRHHDAKDPNTNGQKRQSKRKPKGLTSRKAKRAESLAEDCGRRVLETHYATFSFCLSFLHQQPLVQFGRHAQSGSNSVVLSGWRWRPALGFLAAYFGNDFQRGVMHRDRVREALRGIIPVDFMGRIVCVNKETLKGKQTHSKQYRRMAEKNSLQESTFSKEPYYYHSRPTSHPAEVRKGRTIERKLKTTLAQ